MKLVRIGASLMLLENKQSTITAAPGGRVAAKKVVLATQDDFLQIITSITNG